MTENNEVLEVEEKSTWDEALENESWIAPLADIYETADEYFLVANMPGVTRENIKIKIEKGDLVIMGRVDYAGLANRKYILKETEIGNYYRKFKVSDSVDENNIQATFDNGQLHVNLPKHERIKPKTIEIK